jgi:hypothetical protein
MFFALLFFEKKPSFRRLRSMSFGADPKNRKMTRRLFWLPLLLCATQLAQALYINLGAGMLRNILYVFETYTSLTIAMCVALLGLKTGEKHCFLEEGKCPTECCCNMFLRGIQA